MERKKKGDSSLKGKTCSLRVKVFPTDTSQGDQFIKLAGQGRKVRASLPGHRLEGRVPGYTGLRGQERVSGYLE